MDEPGTEPSNHVNLDAPFWELYTRGTVIMMAYHRCGPEREPIIARYHILSKEYECLRCGAVRAAVIEMSDQAVSAPEDEHYVGYGDPPPTDQPYF